MNETLLDVLPRALPPQGYSAAQIAEASRAVIGSEPKWLEGKATQ